MAPSQDPALVAVEHHTRDPPSCLNVWRGSFSPTSAMQWQGAIAEKRSFRMGNDQRFFLETLSRRLDALRPAHGNRPGLRAPSRRGPTGFWLPSTSRSEPFGYRSSLFSRRYGRAAFESCECRSSPAVNGSRNCGETCAARRALGCRSPTCRLPNGVLHVRIMQMIAPALAPSWQQRQSRCREELLPDKLLRGVLVFPFQLPGKKQTCIAGGQVLLMQPANGIQLFANSRQSASWQRDRAALLPFAVVHRQ